MNESKDKINDAIRLLRNSGYVVRKYTQRMDNDADKCDGGDEMSCIDCACFVCMAGMDE